VLTISPDKLTVGASGAVFGLMGAAFVGLRSRGIDPFSTGIGGLIVMNLILTFALSRYISVGGHVGGLLAGALGGFLLLDVAPRIRENGLPLMIAACVALSGVLFAGSIWIAYNPVF
jgi:membrane associated rhomboid family serine protease